MPFVTERLADRNYTPSSVLPICRSALNREFFSDTCWTLSMYLEAVAMVPQIYMFQRQASDEGGTVEVSAGPW
jgi:hypothetical protein